MLQLENILRGWDITETVLVVIAMIEYVPVEYYMCTSVNNSSFIFFLRNDKIQYSTLCGNMPCSARGAWYDYSPLSEAPCQWGKQYCQVYIFKRNKNYWIGILLRKIYSKRGSYVSISLNKRQCTVKCF